MTNFYAQQVNAECIKTKRELCMYYQPTTPLIISVKLPRLAVQWRVMEVAGQSDLPTNNTEEKVLFGFDIFSIT